MKVYIVKSKTQSGFTTVTTYDLEGLKYDFPEIEGIDTLTEAKAKAFCYKKKRYTVTVMPIWTKAKLLKFEEEYNTPITLTKSN